MVAKRILEFFVGCLSMLVFERFNAYRDVLFSFSASGGVFYGVLQPSRGSYYGNRLIFSLLCCYHPLGSLVVQGSERLLKTIIAGNQLLNYYHPARCLQNVAE